MFLSSDFVHSSVHCLRAVPQLRNTSNVFFTRKEVGDSNSSSECKTPGNRRRPYIRTLNRAEDFGCEFNIELTLSCGKIKLLESKEYRCRYRGTSISVSIFVGSSNQNRYLLFFLKFCICLCMCYKLFFIFIYFCFRENTNKN